MALTQKSRPTQLVTSEQTFYLRMHFQNHGIIIKSVIEYNWHVLTVDSLFNY